MVQTAKLGSAISRGVGQKVTLSTNKKKRKTVIVNQNSGERERKKFTTQWKIAAEATIHFNLVYAHMCFYHFFFEICRLRIKVPSSTCFDDVKIMN